jgi:hypothetical protein
LSVHSLHRPGFVLLFLLLAGPTACGLRQPTSPPPADPRRSGAALASVVVDNATAHVLSVAFRPAAGPGGEVVVGRVQPVSRAALAPIPAGEPIVLLARREDGRRLELRPRTFEIDAEWTWAIPADAVFRSDGGGHE